MKKAYNKVKQHIEGFCALLKALHEKRDIFFMLDALLSLITFLIPYFLITGMLSLGPRKRILRHVPFLCRLPDGGKIFCWISDYFVLGEIYIHRVYDILFCPKKGSVVVDVGAHVGTYTLKTAKEVGDDGLIISVEPHPSNFKLLRLNLAINNIKNVIPLECALSSFDGRVKLYMRGAEKGRATARQDMYSIVPEKATDEYIEVPSLTLDSLLNELDVRNVDLVKIDVEGAELEVIKGSKNVCVNRFVIAAYHSKYEVEEIEKVLILRNYEVASVNRFVYAHLSSR